MQCFEILPHLCLSDRSFASCKQCLLDNKITHVLTIDSVELAFVACSNHSGTDQSSEDLGALNLHLEYIYALDQLNFNLLDLFQQAIDILKKCIEISCKSKVLVHCVAGQSRSVSIVVAYLMSTQNVSLKEALNQVKSIKPDAQPNIGFLKQLCLFESMGKRIDVTSSEYKSYRAKQEQLIYYRSFCEQDSVSEFNVEDSSMNIDNHLSTSKAGSYKCKKCRILLFSSSDLDLSHSSPSVDSTAMAPFNSIASKLCTSYHLLEPLDWMKQQMQKDVQGKNIKERFNDWKTIDKKDTKEIFSVSSTAKNVTPNLEHLTGQVQLVPVVFG